MSIDRRAPHGKYIVGEADTSEDTWGRVGEPFDSAGEALAVARRYRQMNATRAHLLFNVYDDTGKIFQAGSVN